MKKERKKIVAGNWKMNLSFSEARHLVSEISSLTNKPPADVILFPPSVYLAALVTEFKNTSLLFGAQNCSEHTTGAFTGEISASIIKSAGANYCLIGHSERRKYFNETNQQLAAKLNQCITNQLEVIFCIGEELEARNNSRYFETIQEQLSTVITTIPSAHFSKLTLAYEPVWAIGTGLTATPDQAQEMHHFIRKQIETLVGKEAAVAVRILYGGSCNAKNAKELFACPDVDGGLIGGASLIAKDFISIIKSC